MNAFSWMYKHINKSLHHKYVYIKTHMCACAHVYACGQSTKHNIFLKQFVFVVHLLDTLYNLEEQNTIYLHHNMPQQLILSAFSRWNPLSENCIYKYSQFTRYCIAYKAMSRESKKCSKKEAVMKPIHKIMPIHGILILLLNSFCPQLDYSVSLWKQGQGYSIHLVNCVPYGPNTGIVHFVR